MYSGHQAAFYLYSFFPLYHYAPSPKNDEAQNLLSRYYFSFPASFDISFSDLILPCGF
jgi:hypothetical protein